MPEKFPGRIVFGYAVALVPLFLIPIETRAARENDRPNFVIIFADDMGYGDWGYAGHPTIRTPNLERMAREGVVMTQFYTASPVCSPSRASLLTGRYFVRTGVHQVFFPFHETGLPRTELTLATLLKQNDYATACIGKWHLGHHPDHLPTRHGFDTYFGVPYSNDMEEATRGDPPLPLMLDAEIIEQPCDQTTLTRRYTEESIEFINANKDGPFLLYLAHTMPHIPLFRSAEFADTSKRGIYGDVIEEIDWSVGRLLEALKEAGVDENTFVIFTSDNGPWTMKGLEGGTPGLLRSGKATTWEGGIRVPFIARFPRRLPAGMVTTEPGITMDIFTTIMNLAGVPLPDDRIIDGRDLMPVLAEGAPSPHSELYFYWGAKLRAMRSGAYKVHFEKSVIDWQWTVCDPPELYNVEVDPAEKHDIAGTHPEIVDRLTRLGREFAAEIDNRAENTDTMKAIDDAWIPIRGAQSE